MRHDISWGGAGEIAYLANAMYFLTAFARKVPDLGLFLPSLPILSAWVPMYSTRLCVTCRR